MSSSCDLSTNLGLDLVRATEAAALAAGRWTGLGRLEEAERAAADAMTAVLKEIDIDGAVCFGEEGRIGAGAAFAPGERVGTGVGPPADVLVDALEGRRLLAGGYPGALSAVAVAPRGAIWIPSGVGYMDKIVVNAEVAPALAPECLDAPAAWTLALVARAKGKQVRDLVVFVLDRQRHADLVAEIRAAGSHVLLRSGGDLAGALMAGLRDGKVDLLTGSGGVSQGMLAACALKATGGEMLVRLTATTRAEEANLRAGDPDMRRVRSLAELVVGQCAFFVATGITDSPLLNGVRYHGPRAESNSIILRTETGIRRTVLTEHWIHE